MTTRNDGGGIELTDGQHQGGAPHTPQPQPQPTQHHGGGPHMPQAQWAEPQGSGPHGPGPGAPAPRPSRVLEITGFVLSFFGVFAIAGLVLSVLSYRRAGRSGQPRGLSLAGIVISIVVLVLTVAAIVAAVAGFSALLQTCAELGPGRHVVDGVTYTCG